jgi:FtsP/CotA-like multicopper oxidase with cupredoxin domain
MSPHRSPSLALPSRRDVAAGFGVAMALIGGRARAEPTSHAPVQRLTAAKASWALRPPPASATPVLSYDGSVPGPVIRARQGEELALDIANLLPSPTSFHIAGMRLPNASDGVPLLTGKAIAAGDTASLRLPTRDAGFFTFGPSDPASAAEQNARGLGGVLIVADSKDPHVDTDIVLMLRDWRVDQAGPMEESFADPALRVGQGRLGNVFTIGGLGEKRLIALSPGQRFRLRIANLCNARLLPLKFEGLRPSLIGVSGQQSAVFTPLHGEMLIIPGGRFDLVCDIPADARPPAEPRLLAAVGAGFPLLAVALTDDTPSPGAELPPIGWLSDNGLPEIVDLRHAMRVTCEVTRLVDPKDAKALAAADPTKLWAINGRSGDLGGRPLFSVKRGSPVVVAIANKTDVPIVMKLNGHVARLLHPRDDGWAPYWVDVVLVGPSVTERIAFVADNPGRWLIGGRILDHLAGGQFGWFEVM